MPATPPQSHEDAQREFALTLSGFSATDKPEYEDYSRCVHCGLCSNNCPTYRLWGREADSPRGRIRQMALVDQGRLEIGDTFVTHIDRCLNCRNCESVCPSGVEYGKILELARAQIEQKYKRPFTSRVSARFRLSPSAALSKKNRRRCANFCGFIKARDSHLSLARQESCVCSGLQDRESLLPKIDSNFFFSELGKTFPAQGKQRARVAFFAGCVAQVTFSELNRATIRVLQANGCEVVVTRRTSLLRCACRARRRPRRGAQPGSCKLPCFSRRRFRRHHHQRRRLRLHAEGIFAFVHGKRSRLRKRTQIFSESSRHFRISC